jgi:hypothetical protein
MKNTTLTSVNPCERVAVEAFGTAPVVVDFRSGAWRVVCTGARREKIVARHCGDAGIPYFVPLARVARQYGSHAFRVEIPLFAGYLFAQAAEATLRAADRTGSIRSVVDAPQAETGLQLLNLRKVLDRDVPLFQTSPLGSGPRVEVQTGELAGVQGRVDHHQPGVRRLVLEVDAVGLAVSAAIEADATLLPVNP